MTDKKIVSAASFYNKKVFFDVNLDGIPESVKLEIIDLCKRGAELIQGIFSLGITADGNVSLEAKGNDNDFHFDEIGAKLIVDKLVKENEALIKDVQLWHALYITEQGKRLKDKLLNMNIL